MSVKRPAAPEIPVDQFRAIVFPNRLREQRRVSGYSSLLALSALLPSIPYIRLSKIERGEVFAKAEELAAIGGALGVAPVALLIDVNDPGFDMRRWVANRGQQLDFDEDAEQLAVLLAAAFRKNRQADRDLPLSVLESAYGLPPVIVSRVENAVKTPDRWNAVTTAAICAVMGVPDFPALEAQLRASFASGALKEWLARLPGEASRIARTAERVEGLRAELLADPVAASVAAPQVDHASQAAAAARPLLPVFGAPLPDGLVAMTRTSMTVEAPRAAGPASYGLRLCLATLGAGIPASATLVVDPDVLPVPGSLAVLRDGDSCRVVSLAVDRHGAMSGYSVTPDREIAVDALDPGNVHAVIAIYFI